MDNINKMTMIEDIKTAIKSYLDSIYEKKWDKLSNILDESFTYFTDRAKKQNKAEFMNFMIADPWQGNSYSLDLIKVIFDDTCTTAIACYNSAFNGELKNVPMKVTAVETTVLKRINNEWKIVHSHTSNN